VSARSERGPDVDQGGDEPERYELTSPPLHRFDSAVLPLNLDRRAFFRLLGGGLVVVSAIARAEAQESGGGGRGQGRGPATRELGAWLHIGEDGTITVFTGKVEVGQDARTSLTQAVLEELPARLESVRLVMGDTGQTPFDPGTFGSRTTPSMAPQLRRVAATARQLLAARAAALWKVAPGEVVVDKGQVTHPPSRRSTSFGALTKGQRLLEVVSDDTPLKPADRWTVAGRSQTKVDARDVVTGARRFTSDLKRPNLLIGQVLRPPRFGAELEALDEKAAAAIEGVKVVHDGAFAGVVAPDAHRAAQALAALRPRWKEAPSADLSSKDLAAALRKSARHGGGRGDQDQGDVEQGLGAGAHRLAASYEVAYIAHVPLEPRAAVAEWAEGKLTVWTGTQRPFGVRRELAEAFRLPETDVRVIVPDTGSGYGGKHTGDAALEAARLARAAGRPVKVVWSREEEFTWAYFRPAGVIDIRAAADGEGKLTAWEATNYNSGASGLRTPYQVANQRHRFVTCESPLRQGSYRGLAATANHFARESHMDELAALAKLDPLTFRERNLADPRLRAVLQAAVERFGWTRDAKPAPGHGRGLACGIEKSGYVASCVELTAGAGEAVKLERIVTAFECGAVVNPDHLINQIEGSVIMGLGGALFEAIEFAGGRIQNPDFISYRVPRITDVPKLETVLVDRRDLPSAGAGETPIVAVAPAVANALAVATRRRYRSLPLRATTTRG
jgi:isoquinoline 1-oxidoreductase